MICTCTQATLARYSLTCTLAYNATAATAASKLAANIKSTGLCKAMAGVCKGVAAASKQKASVTGGSAAVTTSIVEEDPSPR